MLPGHRRIAIPAFGFAILHAALVVNCLGQETATNREELEFFERKIRPLLAEHCWECHAADSNPLQGGLRLDDRDAILAGGDNGPSVNLNAPDTSLLLQVVQYRLGDLEMPPAGKLPDHQIALLEEWIARGLPMPEISRKATPADRVDLEQGRNHWAFQPLSDRPAPVSSHPDWSNWPNGPADSWIAATLESQRRAPVEASSRRAWMRRASIDLLGVAATYDQIEAFVSDSRDDAYERQVDAWLASPRLGEKWGRSWLELVRYSDVLEEWAEIHHAYRYRDWVVQAINSDLPYPQFASYQLAADQIPDAKPEDLAALGMIGISPSYWKELQLPVEIIKMIVSDEYEERVHTFSSTFLGINMACARCHDHKFDPITTEDYYALAAVFANTRIINRVLDQQIDSLAVLDAKSKLKQWEPKLQQSTSAMEPLRKKEAEGTLTVEETEKLSNLQKELDGLKEQIEAARKTPGIDLPSAPGAIDARLQVLEAVGTHGSRIEYSPQMAPMSVEIRGNPNRLGEAVEPRFVSVLSTGVDSFGTQGSGRKQLAESLFQDARPLVARVMVNRIFAQLFGRGIVATPSDFGNQGIPPSHPELLDHLASQWIAHQWSIKWLLRELVLSSTYRQRMALVEDERSRPEVFAAYPLRRLEVESWRDSVLLATGSIDWTMGGIPQDLSDAGNVRRTLYGLIKRRELNDLLRLYDFPDPLTHSPSRIPTTTPLQQLFVLNGPFLRQQAEALVERLNRQAGSDRKVRIEQAYRWVFGRDPEEAEVELAEQFLDPDHPQVWHQWAHALLSSNELAYLE
jgi:hypothetical protein